MKRVALAFSQKWNVGSWLTWCNSVLSRVEQCRQNTKKRCLSFLKSFRNSLNTDRELFQDGAFGQRTKFSKRARNRRDAKRRPNHDVSDETLRNASPKTRMFPVSKQSNCIVIIIVITTVARSEGWEYQRRRDGICAYRAIVYLIAVFNRAHCVSNFIEKLMKGLLAWFLVSTEKRNTLLSLSLSLISLLLSVVIPIDHFS